MDLSHVAHQTLFTLVGKSLWFLHYLTGKLLEIGWVVCDPPLNSHSDVH